MQAAQTSNGEGVGCCMKKHEKCNNNFCGKSNQITDVINLVIFVSQTQS